MADGVQILPEPDSLFIDLVELSSWLAGPQIGTHAVRHA